MTPSLLLAPSDIRRDRKRCETYVRTHQLLAGYVERKKLSRECEEALEEALLNEDIQRTLGLAH